MTAAGLCVGRKRVFFVRNTFFSDYEGFLSCLLHSRQTILIKVACYLGSNLLDRKMRKFSLKIRLRSYHEKFFCPAYLEIISDFREAFRKKERLSYDEKRFLGLQRFLHLLARFQIRVSHLKEKKRRKTNFSCEKIFLFLEKNSHLSWFQKVFL